ncbi:MAG TPA: hypothetical protein VFT51_15310 [Bacillales bacterium]|nr:hypothetical protein [Bacillales bacterium]
MDMAIIFMIIACGAPFLFLRLRRFWLAGIQSLLLIGMWGYFILSINPETVPVAFSILWFAFYGGLVLSEIAYVLFAVKLAEKIRDELKDGHKEHSNQSDDPLSDH